MKHRRKRLRPDLDLTPTMDVSQWAASMVAAVTGEPFPTGVYKALLTRRKAERGKKRGT